MNASEIRTKYLNFFKKLNHAEIPSAPLVPENDTSTLFTSAGMQPLINYILGEPHPMGKRLVDSQKSFRTQDIMEVGDNRHTTFFEMLGNWSLGDYFKKEQLRWFFTWLVSDLGLDPNRLLVSVYEGNPSIGVPKDEESIAIWQELFKEKGVEAVVVERPASAPPAGGTSARQGRIFMYGDKKNWWSRSGEPSLMPLGEPGGPDSEVFFDFDPDGKYKFHENSPFKNEKCHPNCDCGRFLEIGNSVFMQYKKTEKGFEELSQKCVDFGGGLERITAAVNDTPDVFQTDLFLPIIREIEKISGKQYQMSFLRRQESNDPLQVKHNEVMRIIADHIKASAMLIKDGVIPSNKQRGYILRRLLRRAIWYGVDGLHIKDPFIGKLVSAIGEIYKNTFADIENNKDIIIKYLSEEETKFLKKLEIAKKEIPKLVDKKLKLSAGKLMFYIYQTYGFTPDLIRKILIEDVGYKLSNGAEEEFEEEFKKHQELSRTASAGMFKGGLADSSAEVTKLHTATHLLHQALRTILGNSLSQKGSNITKERLRFDFNFDRKIEPAELKKVEGLVNEQIQKELPVTMEITTLDAARKNGALAFFGEKYGEKVKVYTINGFSKEVCGGPHVQNTKELGKFSIIKEESAGSGVRRIYAKL